MTRRAGLTIAALAAGAWIIAYLTNRQAPAYYDFIALYASARLVALGRPADVTDPAAIFAMEGATRADLPAPLNNPNPPIVSLILAPIGALPFELAYPVMLTLAVLAIAGAAVLLAPLAAPAQRGRLRLFAFLSPPTLVALAQGQLTPFVLLAIAGALRSSGARAGLLLSLTALRPQLLPLFALCALADRRRAIAFVAGVAGIVAASAALVGPDGLARYPALVTYAAAEGLPDELGLGSLVRRLFFGTGGSGTLVSIVGSALTLLIGAIAVLRAPTSERPTVAGPWALLGAPHALLHDPLVAYPAVAAQATTAPRTYAWVLSGIGAMLLHGAGIPAATLWLGVLALARLPRRYTAGVPQAAPVR